MSHPQRVIPDRTTSRDDLIAYFRNRFHLPRKTSPMKPAKLALDAGTTNKAEFKIVDEVVEVEVGDPPFVCKYCLIQYLKPIDEITIKKGNFIRFSYNFLKEDGKFKPGGQTTLMAPADIVNRLVDKAVERRKAWI